MNPPACVGCQINIYTVWKAPVRQSTCQSARPSWNKRTFLLLSVAHFQPLSPPYLKQFQFTLSHLASLSCIMIHMLDTLCLPVSHHPLLFARLPLPFVFFPCIIRFWKTSDHLAQFTCCWLDLAQWSENFFSGTYIFKRMALDARRKCFCGLL